MKLRIKSPEGRRTALAAFTLVEVVIAVAIFFMAMFSILGVLSTELHAASILRSSGPTPGMRAAELSMTNKFEEGTESGDFGDIYPGYKWKTLKTLTCTNGLWQVDIAVLNPSGRLDSTMSVLFYKPDSGSSHMGLQ